jgi:HD-GYP domain-containing protein (c-di-GMP phosphodiesterase class II)
MALLAEFVPVSLSQRGVRVTFTLPYIAGMAIAAGPFAALLTDVFVTLVAGAVLLVRRRQSLASWWLVANAGVAALSCAAGAFASAAFLAASPDAFGWMPLAALPFLVAYGLTNFGLVTYLEWLSTGRMYRGNVLGSLKLGVHSLALYTVVAIAVVTLVREGAAWIVPLTFVPVMALRAGLACQAQMYEHYYETIRALTLMLQRAHPYTHGHIERVALIAEEVGLKLGLSRRRARMLREAAVLHDIGKIAIDEEILDKPGRLSSAEMDHVRLHSVYGAQILAPVKDFYELVPWVRHHHERPDGTGYPDRLTDQEIPLESKIIAVVDAFDAMTGGNAPEQHRSYRASIPMDQAIEELERCSGTQFDAKVVRVFREILMRGTA